MADAYLAVVSGLPRKVLVLTPGAYVLGRAPDASLLLSHVSISRHHCRLIWNGEVCEVEDLGSQRGTLVNGVPVHVKTALSPGDRISVGPALIEFAIGEPPAQVESDATQEEPAVAPLVVRGQPADFIPLPGAGEEWIIGRDQNADVMLGSPEVSRRHAALRRDERGNCVVSDLNSTAGSFVNGRRFDTVQLTIGDRLQIGPFCLQFNGQGLSRLTSAAGGAIDAINITARVGSVVLLDAITLHLAPSQFIGIIGPSGAGKSTLLHSLSGLREPQTGRVLIDGIDVYSGKSAPSFGFVPQEDIVHPELTVTEALRYGARLRLSSSTPEVEIQKLVFQVMDQLGLRERALQPIHRLSGGQRKRVSVAVELLAKPRVLFLDEPSSGLDPATEFQLMELLRDLADTGCTIVCTTHVMENAYLMDQLVVLTKGCLTFQGTAQEARDYFGVNKLTGLYECLSERTGPQWRDEWLNSAAAAKLEALPKLPEEPAPCDASRSAAPFALPILLRRQASLLFADWRNLIILFGQPLIIAGLVSWVTDEKALVLFFAYIATLWFGCSNGAQEIVKEVPIYRRERLIGVGTHSYLLSKFGALTLITVLQSLLLWIVMFAFEKGLDGSLMWQGAALGGTAAAAVGIGLGISGLARSVMQAVLIVPLLIIPQIIFSGYTVPAHDMRQPVYTVSKVVPTFAAQTLVDLSFLWGKQTGRSTIADHYTSLRNLQREWPVKTNAVYARTEPGVRAGVTLIVWTVLGYAVAWAGLRSKERH
jgi:ABC-type multidrug transport system ATPase subunit/pSer/pThr/pTyr-binding forkhead associated (FHA) protein